MEKYEIVQGAGGAAVALGLAMQWPWLGALFSGVFILAFGVAMELRKADEGTDARTTPTTSG